MGRGGGIPEQPRPPLAVPDPPNIPGMARRRLPTGRVTIPAGGEASGLGHEDRRVQNYPQRAIDPCRSPGLRSGRRVSVPSRGGKPVGLDRSVTRRPVLRVLATGITCLALPSAAAASSSVPPDVEGQLSIVGATGSDGSVTLTWEDDP